MNPIACPFLPPPSAQMSYRDLQQWNEAQSIDRYLSSLKYGHYLWLHRRPARAILALIRALNTPLRNDPNESILKDHPLPYAAIGWICKYHTLEYGFLGNPRISFQHQADRLSGQHAPIRRARAWAAWYLVSAVRPDFPSDPKHHPIFPSGTQIIADLDTFGTANESIAYREALSLFHINIH